VIYVIEGVAGSGKDTLCAQLVEALKPKSRRVLVFPEEAMLASWLHYFVPGIHEQRLDLADRMLDYVEDLMGRDPEASFVFNRFHVSYAVWRHEHGVDLEARHERLITRMQQLPLLVVQAMLPEQDADTRSSHIERRELAWQRFLEDRIAFHGQSSAGQSYLDQQVAMSEIIARDALPNRQVEVRRDQCLDLSLFGLG
jgi:thymidylate kinase